MARLQGHLDPTDQYLSIILIEEFFTSNAVTSPGTALPYQMDEHVWSIMPHDLVTEILFRLPFSSQVRCRSVCKEWNELMKSTAFQQRSALIASSSPDCFWICQLGRLCPIEESFKVHKISIQAMYVHPNPNLEDAMVFCEAGIVGVAWLFRAFQELRCWLLNPKTNTTWLELPTLLIRNNVADIFDWKPLLRPMQAGGLQMSVIIMEHDPAMRTFTKTTSYTSTTASRDWEVFMVIEPWMWGPDCASIIMDPERIVWTKGGYLYADLLNVATWKHMSLRIVSSSDFYVVSIPPENFQRWSRSCRMGSADADVVFVFYTLPISEVSILQLDFSNRQWRLLFSGRLPGLGPQDAEVVQTVQLVRDHIVVLAKVWDRGGRVSFRLLAYHVSEGSGKLPGQMAYGTFGYYARRYDISVGANMPVLVIIL